MLNDKPLLPCSVGRLISIAILMVGFVGFAKAQTSPPINAQNLVTGLQAQSAQISTSIAAAPTTITVPSVGYSVASISVHGTYAGLNLSFFFSDDGGTTYYVDSCTRSDSAVQENTSGVLPTNQSRSWDCGVFASTNFQVQATAYGSGTPIVNVTLSAGAVEPAPTVSMTPIIGTFNSVTPVAVAVDIYGRLITSPVPLPSSVRTGFPLPPCNALVTANCSK